MIGIKYQEEVWKAIHGYEGLYEISNQARVKSLKRVTCQNQKIEETFLSFAEDSRGYCRHTLSLNGKSKAILTHRLVALHFVENEDNKKNIVVNHLDGNPKNNVYTNLEWCTQSENCLYSYAMGRVPTFLNKFGKEHNRSIKISQFSKEGKFIKDFWGSYEVQRELHIDPSKVIAVCKGKRKSAGGFIWKYADYNENK